jgi:catechol 2,3-dioxygenase-like lactoylglutathione lyase family enzyme
MLSNSTITTTVVTTNLERAKDFYGNKLGLKEDPSMTDENGVLYQAGNGTSIYVYKRTNPPVADHTLASFKVANLEAEINALSQKGLSFEHYDLPGLKTDEKGIAVMGPVRSAWFKDPDGNIFSLMQVG